MSRDVFAGLTAKRRAENCIAVEMEAAGEQTFRCFPFYFNSR